jgi:hypothetical protein
MHIKYQDEDLVPSHAFKQVNSRAGGCDGRSEMKARKQETLRRTLLSHGARQLDSVFISDPERQLSSRKRWVGLKRRDEDKE